jgi:putative oxygen-independent coproporphyrinogen III oxidase
VPLGIYISVPFCRTKCTFCNFASGVVSRTVYMRYVDRVCSDLSRAQSLAAEIGGRFEPQVDSIYLGGGTPTVLEPAELERIFAAVRAHFDVDPDSEITVECAPGTLNPKVLEALLRCGVNRVSLGVQSFVDKEAAGVGRLHTRDVVLEDLACLRAAGIDNISIDLIAGLPHQTAESWRYSLQETLNSGVPHVSLYMLEVDEDSRLGSELIAGGARYHAHFVPDDDATADFYLEACDALESAGVHQYEISNFARGRVTSAAFPRWHSRHNLKYWTRQPYLGFGVDAHSMLPAVTPQMNAVRFATPDALEPYVGASPHTVTQVSPAQALEESCFLGLRLNRGIPLDGLFVSGDPNNSSASFSEALQEFQEEGLLQIVEGRLQLTPRGRLLSNEVFQRFLKPLKDPQRGTPALS